MKRMISSLGVLLLALSMLSQARSAVLADDDAKAIQGTWTFTKLETNGKEETPKEKPKLKITADKMLPIGKDDPASYKLGAGDAVKTIDITPDTGSDKGKTLKALYKLDGDSLVLCFPKSSGDERPKDLTPRDGTVIVTFKRDK